MGQRESSGHVEKKTVNLQLLYTQSGIHLKTWPLQHPGCNGKIERLFVDQYVANTYKSILMERGQGWVKMELSLHKNTTSSGEMFLD